MTTETYRRVSLYVRWTGVIATTIACGRIVLRYAERGPYAWMMVFLDAAALLLLLSLAAIVVVASRRAWRSKRAQVISTALSVIMLAPAMGVAVKGWL